MTGGVQGHGRRGANVRLTAPVDWPAYRNEVENGRCALSSRSGGLPRALP